MGQSNTWRTALSVTKRLSGLGGKFLLVLFAALFVIGLLVRLGWLS